VVVPFHSNATLHPKIVKQLFEAIEETSRVTAGPNRGFSFTMEVLIHA